MSKKVMVSADLMALLEEIVNAELALDTTSAQDWRDENQTSRRSNAKGGVIKLETDHDWKIACAIWLYGRPAMVAKLPRER